MSPGDSIDNDEEESLRLVLPSSLTDSPVLMAHKDIAPYTKSGTKQKHLIKTGRREEK